MLKLFTCIFIIFQTIGSANNFDFLDIKIKYTRKIINIYINNNSSIAELKQIIQERANFATAKQNLFYNNIELQDQNTLLDYDIINNTCLLLYLN